MSSFCNAKATHIFSVKNTNVFAIFQDRNFNIRSVLNNWALIDTFLIFSPKKYVVELLRMNLLSTYNIFSAVCPNTLSKY